METAEDGRTGRPAEERSNYFSHKAHRMTMRLFKRKASSPQSKKEDAIDPKKLIERLTVEDFNFFSDEYYKKLLLPEFQLGKPFSMPGDAAQLLVRLGLILENLRVGPGSRVLDFGAGTCWISKALWQMGCDVTAIDVSAEALRLGRRLFEEYPVPMRPDGTWQLRIFDGHRIPLEDSSVDRIICYDAFHHVPNQKEVIAEFHRVLAEGGLIAMNEPLGPHSQTEASQKEMRNFSVLENDLDVEDLVSEFRKAGFEMPSFKVAPAPQFTLTYEEWKSTGNRRMPKSLCSSMSNFARGCGIILFFDKGRPRLDSRQSDGLRHTISADRLKVSAKPGEPAWINIKVKNTGTTYWLHGTEARAGTVHVGTQQIDPSTKRLISEHARFHFDHDVAPGEEIQMSIPIVFAKPGRQMLRLDLVSELVCWFHDHGSLPIYLEADISD